MKRNNSWMAPAANYSYSRGGHYKDSRSSSGGVILKIMLAVAVLVAVLAVLQLLRPVPFPRSQVTQSSSIISGTRPVLPWTSKSGGELDVQNIGAMGAINGNTKFPLGSVAKIVTALVIVKDHPLSLGSSGPNVTVTPSDFSLYQTMLSQNDVVFPVTSGESLSEYKLLEALLVPSANNAAVMLANWDAGSTTAFVTKMNAVAKSLGIHSLTLNGPSGLNPHSVGSAHDMVVVAQALMLNPVLSAIVAKPQATLPGVGVVYNIDYNVGHNGFIGIETGIMGSGGDFVFAASGSSGSKDLIIGAVLNQTGAQPLITALAEGTKLVDAARKVPTSVLALSTSQTLATISAPGAVAVPVRASQDVHLQGWPGLKVSYVTKFVFLGHNVAKGAKVGTVKVSIGNESQTVPLIATSSVQAPSLAWRLSRL